MIREAFRVDREFSFSYHVTLMCHIDGREFEFHKEFRSPVQFRSGDTVYVNGLENVRVREVVWYLDRPGDAFVELEDANCVGVPIDWMCLLEDMDFCVPDLKEKSHATDSRTDLG